MLYPKFEDLVALKNYKSKIAQASARAVKTTQAGNHASNFRGHGLEFDAVREYVPGDDIRNIDWRVTARTGSPHLKLFKEERERHIVLCIDMNATMRFGTRKTFKSVQAAQTAAILGWQSLFRHESVSSYLFGDVVDGVYHFPPKKTRQPFYSLLKTLTEPPTHQYKIPVSQVTTLLSKKVASGSIVYIISDFLDLDFHFQDDTVLGPLSKKCRVVLISVNDPADQQIPPVGTLLFSSGAERLTVNTLDANARAIYTDLWTANRKKLYQIGDKYKIPIIELTTQSDINRELRLSLKRISKKRTK
jgi:uncharacterized protein (DUF58 family)